MNVEATKVDKRFLHLEFESRRDRDKFYEKLMEMMK